MISRYYFFCKTQYFQEFKVITVNKSSTVDLFSHFVQVTVL